MVHPYGVQRVFRKKDGEEFPAEIKADPNLRRMPVVVLGLGLGLAVFRNLVEVNCGIIEVEREEGQGSRFTLWLPVIKES